MGSEMCIRDSRDAEQRSDASGKYGKPFGRGSDTHLMFEHRTEVDGWLSVNPQCFQSEQWSSEDFRSE